MTDKQRIDRINAHREALGYEPFASLTNAEINHHQSLIDEYAPYGCDPWVGEHTYIIARKANP